jgi:hypothetical protein
MMSVVVLETCWGDNVIYILQNKKLGASSWSQKIDLHHDARSEKHKTDKCYTVTYRGGVWGVQTPPPRNFDKVPKIKKILLYEIKFLVPNYSCLKNPWLGGHCPQIPVLSVLNWICWTPPPNKIPGYATGVIHTCTHKDRRGKGMGVDEIC